MLERLQKYLPRGKRSLQTRFQIGLAVILFFFCLLSVIAVYSLQRNMLEREALRQTNLVMNSLQATRGYVREILRPKMYEVLPDNSFVIEAMSTSYITRVIMQNVKQDLPEFDYRRVAANPRNPEFEPNHLEAEMIDYFRKNREKNNWVGVVRTGGRQQFTRFQPVRFSESCMLCHGDPQDAPAGIIERYGPAGGFHKKAGEIGGVVSVSIPLENDLSGIRTSVFRLFLCILGSVFLLFLFIRLFFQRLVVVNIHSLLEFFRETVSDARGSELYYKMTSRDEVKEMTEGVRLLAEHIRDSRKKLEDNAMILEEKVALRTEALERSHDQLRRQIKQRNSELHLFTVIAELTTGTEPLRAILAQVLQETLKVIPCEKGTIYLYENEQFVPCCSSNISTSDTAFIMPENRITELERDADSRKCKSIRFFAEEDCAAIPLRCRNRTLGFFFISRLQRDQVDEPLRDLLVSIGNQIGIAVDSIQNTRALSRSEQLLRSVFKGISDPLILIDKDGTLKMVNDAFLSYHDLTEKQVLDLSIAELMERKDCLLAKPSVRLDLTLSHPRNQLIHDDDGNCFDIFFYPVVNDAGKVSSVICFARDVTEMKKVEQKMHQTEKLAALGQLAAGVAHEINNPLWVILCNADIIKSDYAGHSELIQDIETIERHAAHCRKIIGDLLNFTRKRENGTSMRTGPINDTVRHVTSIVETQFSKKQIRLETDLDRSEPCCLFDANGIQQVFMNLLINAGQAVESDGTIRVMSAKRDKKISVSIEDDGPGISPEAIDHIFDPFFTTKKQGEGTGLGLSVSYGIVKNHNGDIYVTSRPGKTVFTVAIPLYEENL